MIFKKNRVKFICTTIVLSVVICVCIIYYISYHEKKCVFSDIVNKKIDLNNDGKEERVEFNKGELNIFSADGNVILKKDRDENVYSDIAFLKDKGTKDIKIIFENKTKDTSSTLSYSILKMDGSEIKEVAHKENIYKGVVTVNNNGDILEESPTYAKNDCNAVPSYTVKNYFSLKNNKLDLLKTEKIKYTPSNVSSASAQYYKNPSKAEIEKILENIAYEKGIPAEIFKAIAWQESRGTDNDNGGIENWRQFYNGQPLIGYDHIGIGIMQVSDYDPANTVYVNRLKYDIEFNIREGAEILLKKWALQKASAAYKIPIVGDGAPNYLEHWYYSIWAYNGYSARNNPASNYSIAYQTLIIGHVNKVFNKPMIDLYVYKPSLFTAGTLPRTDITEINSRNAGDFKKKDINYSYISTIDGLTIRDANMVSIGTFSKNDVLTIKGEPIIKDCYVRYYVEGNNKSGYVASNWLKPVGDVNLDRVIDIYDFVNESKNIAGVGTVVNDTNRISIEKFDVNMDGIVDIKDIALTSKNYNCSFYKNNITK